MNKILILFFLIMGLETGANAQGFGHKELLNNDWYFNLGDIQYGGREYMDCSKWTTVNLPHDWSVEQNASPELASCTGYLPGGIGWYRKEITIPAAEKRNNVYIYFEGVYNNSEVFINGKWLGKRPNGYISFMYELTPYIKWGEKNSIAVKVNHSEDADSRWYTGSGIYRDVYLVYANPIHINLWGVAYQTEVEGNKAVININTTLDNTIESATVKIVQELFDAEGNRVASTSKSGKAGAKTKTDFSQTIKLDAPKLWNIDSPYLYTLKTKVYKGAELMDDSSCKAGIRKIEFDPNSGFSLNGKNTKLKGVCIHHDAGVLGSAVPKSVWRHRLEQLKSLGCNAIRTSHNPQAPCLYDLCDELGFVIMDEAFDEWEYPKNKWIEGWNRGTPGHQGSYEYFREWNTRDLQDQILRDRNHPSVIMWSIGNEVDYPNDPYSHPVLDKEDIGQQHVHGFLKDHPRAERLGEIAKELVAAAKKADSSRPVTAALAGAVMSNYTDYPFVLDVVGYNYTENRYDMDHQKYPDRILFGSENRHDIQAWYAVKNKAFIFGQFLWTGIDYLGEAGAWPSRGSSAGLINLAGDIKPRGYFRKSLWSEKPMAYVGTYQQFGDRRPRRGNRLSIDVPHIWNYDKNAPVKVVCYTNCEEAELQLNGKVIGERKPYDKETGIIAWDVNYEPGELKVVAFNSGKEAATDNIITNTMPASLKAEVMEAKDNDLVRQVIVTVLDENGNHAFLADNEITCRVTGGTLLGMENASLDVSENFRDNRQRCINGRLMIYVKKDSTNAPVSLKLSSPLMESVTLEIK
ncbi:MAG TPA: glycoside hydrolase family 2 TIM barrel-domain containing protein [Draconibacterium sp.]|nr:glycoside hydrolase family 2 TIM barrel-domain containing protein [Draconibacterium sp.]